MSFTSSRKSYVKILISSVVSKDNVWARTIKILDLNNKFIVNVPNQLLKKYQFYKLKDGSDVLEIIDKNETLSFPYIPRIFCTQSYIILSNTSDRENYTTICQNFLSNDQINELTKVKLNNRSNLLTLRRALLFIFITTTILTIVFFLSMHFTDGFEKFTKLLNKHGQTTVEILSTIILALAISVVSICILVCCCCCEECDEEYDRKPSMLNLENTQGEYFKLI